MKKLKQIFSLQRIVLFLFISGLFLVFYTPHLAFRVDLDHVTDGSVLLANYNTDRGEEIFENYNYSGHKTWTTVNSDYTELAITDVPIVTNSLQMKLDGVEEMVINKITISFGPYILKEYTTDNFTREIAGSQGLDISFEDEKLHLSLQNVEGWIQFNVEEYMPKMYIFGVYILVMIVAWILAVIISDHIDFIDKIPLNEFMLLACPCWIFFMSESVLGNIFYIALGLRLLNVGILIVLYKLIYFIFRRRAFAVNLCNIGVVVYSIVSTFVVRFRNRPIAPWDFSAWSTALDVSSNYEIQINYMMVTAVIVCLALYLVMMRVPKHKTKLNIWHGAYPIIIIVVALFFSSIGSYYLWDIRLLNTFQTEGTILSFTGLVRQYLYSQPTEPDGYGTEALQEIAAETEQTKQEIAEDAIVPTTIIQIMNESWSDLNIGGTTYASDITPYIDSLENTIRGKLYVSVRGGGTCNSEYETLTGNSTSFLADGVYPYNMYMTRTVPSMVTYMNENGYSTTGIHLGKSTNWNRRTAYQKLEFDDTIFAETFDGLETVHGYPTDAQDFEILIENYEENKGSNQYIFNVTYQNHGSYKNADDLEQTIDLSEYGTANYDNAENYLSLLRMTDEAYKDLIAYFSNVDENVMIIMYGDHQPSLGTKCDNLFFPYSGTPEEDIKQYITPFVIWANYDIPDETIEMMSSNYMPSLILHSANMEMTTYQQYLYNLMQEYPVISLYGCYDAEGNFYESVDDIDDEAITKYQMLQYNNIFDSDRMTDLFWPDTENQDS